MKNTRAPGLVAFCPLIRISPALRLIRQLRCAGSFLAPSNAAISTRCDCSWLAVGKSKREPGWIHVIRSVEWLRTSETRRGADRRSTIMHFPLSNTLSSLWEHYPPIPSSTSSASASANSTLASAKPNSNAGPRAKKEALSRGDVTLRHLSRSRDQLCSSPS